MKRKNSKSTIGVPKLQGLQVQVQYSIYLLYLKDDEISDATIVTQVVHVVKTSPSGPLTLAWADLRRFPHLSLESPTLDGE